MFLTHIKKEGKLIDINIQVLIIKSKSVTVRSLTRLTRREPPVEQELPTLSEHLSTLSVFSGVCITRCVCFVNHCLSLCTFSFGHCVVCSSSN